MRHYLRTLLLTTAVGIPLLINAQGRDDKHYEDKAYNDSHQLNSAKTSDVSEPRAKSRQSPLHEYG